MPARARNQSGMNSSERANARSSSTNPIGGGTRRHVGSTSGSNSQVNVPGGSMS